MAKSVLTSNKVFYLLVLGNVVFAIVLSAIFVGTRANNTIRDLSNANSSVQAELVFTKFEDYINNHLQVSKDLTENSIFANAVMGVNSNDAQLKDVIESVKIIGSKESIALVDIAGNIIASNSIRTGENTARDAHLNQPWFTDIIESNAPHSLSLIQKDNAHLRVVVPIKYNEYVEGALIVVLQSPIDDLFTSFAKSNNNQLSIAGPYINYQSNTDQDVSIVQSKTLNDIGLTLSYGINNNLIEQQSKGFMLDLVTALLLSIITCFTFLAIINYKLFLNPFKKLVESQKQLKDSELRFQLAVEGANDGIWDWDLTNNEFYYSPRLRALLGYDGEDYENMPNELDTLLTIVHPEDMQPLASMVKEHLKASTPYIFECRFKHASGDYLYFLIKGKALRDASGWATRISGSLSLIHEQKMAEQALIDAKQRNELLAKAIAFSPIGVSIADARDSALPLTYVNNAFELMTGYSSSEILGRNCRFLQGEETNASVIENINDAIKNKHSIKCTLLNYKKDGTKFWNNLHISPILDDANELVAFVGIQQDITLHKKVEQQQKAAVTAAEEANLAKSQFLASMSHEIRTPLNGVIGMLSLLNESHLDDNQRQRLSLAESSANSLMNVINDVLDFSKIDAGKLQIEIIDFNVHAMLNEFTAIPAMQADQKGITFILDTINLKQPFVKGDPTRLRQILNNLVGNALKFTEQGEIVIRAEIEEVNDQQLELTCIVKDTGIGIPKDKLERLFDSFSQVDSSTTRRFGGTGLGLTIVKQLCQLMNGDISVQSNPGEGSEFTIKLPMQPSELKPEDLPEIDFSKLKVLVVDDNVTNIVVIKGQLEHWGAKVTYKTKPQEVIDLCLEQAEQGELFDIAIIDMQMPDISGADLAIELKNNPTLAAMKLIMMTSATHPGDAKYFAGLGFHGYFSKPVNSQDLLKAIEIIIDSGSLLESAQPLVTHHFIRDIGEMNTNQKSLGHLKVILAEDNKVNQLVAVGNLKKLGIKEIDVANNGQLLIDKLNESDPDNPYDLVLMDCQMPVLDGYEATKNIREGAAGELYKNISIIALTAHAMESDRAHCLAVGMNDYITKPIKRSLLAQKLAQIKPFL